MNSVRSSEAIMSRRKTVRTEQSWGNCAAIEVAVTMLIYIRTKTNHFILRASILFIAKKIFLVGFLPCLSSVPKLSSERSVCVRHADLMVCGDAERDKKAL